jgi:acyl-CoA thioesterase
MENWPEYIKNHFATVPFLRFLDVTVVETARGRARLAKPLRPEFANSYGNTHGGVYAALVDMASGVCVRTLKVRVVTVETSVNIFLPTVIGGRLTADAHVAYEGRKILHAEVDVTDDAGELVAKGRAVLYILGEDTGEY